jgi:hypothetical protein
MCRRPFYFSTNALRAPLFSVLLGEDEFRSCAHVLLIHEPGLLTRGTYSSHAHISTIQIAQKGYSGKKLCFVHFALNYAPKLFSLLHFDTEYA